MRMQPTSLHPYQKIPLVSLAKHALRLLLNEHNGVSQALQILMINEAKPCPSIASCVHLLLALADPCYTTENAVGIAPDTWTLRRDAQH